MNCLYLILNNGDRIFGDLLLNLAEGLVYRDVSHLGQQISNVCVQIAVGQYVRLEEGLTLLRKLEIKLVIRRVLRDKLCRSQEVNIGWTYREV